MKNIQFSNKNSLPRGLLLAFIFLVFVFISARMVYPVRVAHTDASLEDFSAEHAMAHLPVIAKEPHPQGSPAQAAVRDYLADQLGRMGYEVEVQQTHGLENVVARLRGTDPTGAIVILSHYDSVSSSPGAGDNGSGASVLLEIARALSMGPAPLNDIIILFDDGEELPDAFSGTRAFVYEHRWMENVRVAISLDTAVAGPISTDEVGPRNGWLVDVLASAYTGGAWTSFSGGGNYDCTPFRNAGYLVLALEDNYPIRQKHTAEDLTDIVRPASVQQMGDQTLAIARELGDRDLSEPWGEQETFFAVPPFGLVHYPEAWSLPLAVTAGFLLLLALGLSLWHRLVTWRGLGIALGLNLAVTVLVVLSVTLLQPKLPGLFSWEIYHWPEWPEVIPPYGGLVVAGIDLLVLGLVLGNYLLGRRWSGWADYSLACLVPFLFPAVALAISTPRAAYAFIWPVFIGSLGWITAVLLQHKGAGWGLYFGALLAALPLVILILPFLPGVVMADGMKSLNILAGVEALMLGVFLPVFDDFLVRRTVRLS